MRGEYQDIFSFGIDNTARRHLETMMLWMKVLGMVALIAIGLTMVGGTTIAMQWMARVNYHDQLTRNIDIASVGMVYVLFPALFIFPAVSLLRSARCSIAALKTNDSNLLGKGLGHQKNAFRYTGILTALLFLPGMLLLLVA